MDTQKKILVTGATGNQGGATARSLLKRGHKVLALTRNPGKAIGLLKQGAAIVQGDVMDTNRMETLMAEVDAVFAIATPWGSGGIEAEIEQGLSLANAAKAVGVKHYVYSSVGSATKNTGIPHFESKVEIEKHIKMLALPYTILRPVFFMENFLSPWFMPREGILAAGQKPNTKLQMIAVKDIGEFAAMAFEQPERFLGKEIELAGDAVTFEAAAEALSRLLDQPVSFRSVPLDEVEKSAGRDFALMFKWFNEVGYSVDIPALERDYGIHLTTFNEFISELDKSKVKDLAHAA